MIRRPGRRPLQANCRTSTSTPTRRLWKSRDVHYALAWKPPVGFFARFPNLKLVTNLGAGVDSLVGRTDLAGCADLSPLRHRHGVADDVLCDVLGHPLRTGYPHILKSAQRRSEWHCVHPRALSDIRVGVLGLGELGVPAAAARSPASASMCGDGVAAPNRIPGVTCSSGSRNAGCLHRRGRNPCDPAAADAGNARAA